MMKAMEKCPKRCRSSGCFTGSVLDADSKTRKMSSVNGERPQNEVHDEKKERTTMTKRKRLDSLTRMQSLMSHPYGPESFDMTVVSGAPEKSLHELESAVAMSPRRAARIATLMDRFSGTIKKAEKELADSAQREREAKLKEERKREREAQLRVKEERKRKKEPLERMENTAKFGEDHQALKEFEMFLGPSEFRTTQKA